MTFSIAGADAQPIHKADYVAPARASAGCVKASDTGMVHKPKYAATQHHNFQPVAHTATQPGGVEYRRIISPEPSQDSVPPFAGQSTS